MTKPKTKPRWYREACWSCGEVGLSTRTQDDVPIDKPYYCSNCETWQKIDKQYSQIIKEKDEEIQKLNYKLK